MVSNSVLAVCLSIGDSHMDSTHEFLGALDF